MHAKPTWSTFPWAILAKRRPKSTFLLLAAVLLLGLYGRALTAPFVYDDLDGIVRNPNLTAWHPFVLRFLLRPVDLTTTLSAASPGATYRPIFWLSLFLDRQLWGLNSVGYHLTNLLLHLANGLLAFCLLRRLRLDATPAMAASLAWLALPLNTEVVAWASGRAYLLSTLFLLTTLLAALAYIRHGRPAQLAAIFLATLAAVLSHELAILILPLLLALGLFPGPHTLSRRYAPLLTATLATLLAALWRTHLAAHSLAPLASPRYALLALAQYLQLLALPSHLSVERSTTLTLGHLAWSSWLALGVLALSLAYAFIRRRSNPFLAGGLLWLLLGLAPFCLLRNYQGFAERFTYLASLGLAVALIALCRQPARPALRKALLTATALWFTANLVRTALRAVDWTDPVRLYATSLRATPQSPLLHYNLAFSLRQRGDLPAALAAIQHTLALDARYPGAYASLGDLYLQQARYPEAQTAYRHALALNPHATDVLLNSAAAYAAADQPTEAEQTYLHLLALAPENAAAHTDLGILYSQQHRTDDAMHQYATAIDLKAQTVTPYYNLAVLLQQAGRPDLALVLYRKALEISPNDPDTLQALQTLTFAR